LNLDRRTDGRTDTSSLYTLVEGARKRNSWIFGERSFSFSLIVRIGLILNNKTMKPPLW
jgi:hypothetical protein